MKRKKKTRVAAILTYNVPTRTWASAIGGGNPISDALLADIGAGQTKEREPVENATWGDYDVVLYSMDSVLRTIVVTEAVEETLTLDEVLAMAREEYKATQPGHEGLQWFLRLRAAIAEVDLNPNVAFNLLNSFIKKVKEQ